MYGRVLGTIYISHDNLNGREFIFNLGRYVIEDNCNAMKSLHTQIATLNKKALKNIASYLSDEILRLPCNFKNIQWYHPALNSIDSKIYNIDPRKIKGIHQKIFVKLHLATRLLTISNQLWSLINAIL